MKKDRKRPEKDCTDKLLKETPLPPILLHSSRAHNYKRHFSTDNKNRRVKFN